MIAEWLDQAIERLVSSRPDQGVPLKVEAPLILRRGATVLPTANTERRRANRRANGRQGHG